MDYKQKRNIIKHFATAENWTNIFNDAFFADETRKWKSASQGTITISRSPGGRRTKIIDTEHGRSILIRRNQSGRLKIADEHGRFFIINQGRITARADIVSNVSPIKSIAEIGLQSRHQNQESDKAANIAVIDDLGIILRFFANGSKSIFFENLGHRIDMTAHGRARKSQKANGRFFHSISINEDNIREWDIPPAYAMMFAKLVLAHDLNLEPDIKTLNTLDEEQAVRILLNHLKNPAQANDKQTGIVERNWSDTTEFEGYRVDIAQKFSISRTDHGYDFATTSTQKHAIIAHGGLLIQAERPDIFAVQAVNTRTTAKTILHMIKNGYDTKDHLGQQWKFIVLDSPAALKVVTAMKEAAKNEFDLRADRFAAITFDQTKSLLAIEENALGTVVRTLENSLNSLH